eukprot:m.17114 g.17114  ORF g.17114 m.17114 type:complete len:2059 (+) comp8097_c0_seq2:2-6178(+)
MLRTPRLTSALRAFSGGEEDFPPPEEVEKLIQSKYNDDHLMKSIKDEGATKEFGSKVTYCAPSSSSTNLQCLVEKRNELAAELRLRFRQRADADAINHQIESADDQLSTVWLKHRCEREFLSQGKDTVNSMCVAIYDLLSGSKTEDELQNELFDLLGFDKFEMIQDLLIKRKAIVKAIHDASLSRVPKLSNDTQSTMAEQHSASQTAPSFGTVTILSAEEKKLQKQQQRREKKQRKAIAQAKKKMTFSGTQEDEEFLDLLGFGNPDNEGNHALHAARNKSAFASSTNHAPSTHEKYPFVFDSRRDAQGRGAFIQGIKMVLPSNVERENLKTYETVTIPPPVQRAAMRNERLIAINELSPISQLAFKGYKSLNRVQSIVYETAYKTNNNLLICAPTGAGKTNTAMLTVLHCIEEYMEKGVIQSDKFKIVYVAPMKALAAEMTETFGRRLAPLNLSVKELTGDMQLTKREIMSTNMLVTTPEKWDVVTRKSTGDTALTQLVKLLIIDEVHLLHDERGSVIESIVARTLRLVESSQMPIRIVGLSATLPNYVDVAHFLRVNPKKGLFFFDGAFRPVPLQQTFVGVKGKNRFAVADEMDRICYETVRENIERGEQVMVFVHSRNGTVSTAQKLLQIAQNEGDTTLFDCSGEKDFSAAQRAFSRSSNKQLKQLFNGGFAVHHAGMLRQDRSLVEKFFGLKTMKVLVCTATLAWGVNLPAHAVIIKGTQLYIPKKGGFVDLGILDVQQIFGRAGRPQFDTFGEAHLLTSHDKLSHYLSRILNQKPIESTFNRRLMDHLNAEISLGTVANINEAVNWLSYTYLHVRMRKNPHVYGLLPRDLERDPQLFNHREEIIRAAARKLDEARMIRFQDDLGYVNATDLGRTASNFYINHESIELYNEHFKPTMTEAEILVMLSMSSEFEQIKVREEEISELQTMFRNCCYIQPVKGGYENSHGKVNILLQAYISNYYVSSFSLVSDMHYVAQNGSRILRALFEIALKRNFASVAYKLLTMSKAVDKRLWWNFNTPLRQLGNYLKQEVYGKIESKNFSLYDLLETEADDIGHMLRHVKIGEKVQRAARMIPLVELEATIRPVTRTVLRIFLNIIPTFEWNNRYHGNSLHFWIYIEDAQNEHLYHAEMVTLQGKKCRSKNPDDRIHTLDFTVPIFEPLPPQYFCRCVANDWMGSETIIPLSFRNLLLPQHDSPHTKLLPLQPLPISVLQDKQVESIYKFSHFNPVQTQVFHTVYHTDHNVLLGAPTGSGKTAIAELAIFRVLRTQPGKKAVYIAPLKALVRERIDDWKIRFGKKLGKNVVELTGDVTPDVRAIERADVIVTTPEKWDGISRSWANRNYVKKVTLLVIDEIHLLGGDRGPVLEVIVSRTNYISANTTNKVRVVGLSTALANAHDLANWLGITRAGLFNFKPSVRPVPLTKHIQGFPGKHYCPRMATMNKPAYTAIRTHSPRKPVLIFVSSRRQTRLTALDLISYCVADDMPKQFLGEDFRESTELDDILFKIRDPNLKHCLRFGIGMHHAGLHENDRKVVEMLFLAHKIQVLVATATLAWGVNLPAHLVIVKGTEFFDGKTKRYVDFDITDILQMTGRAGRPQFDDHGVAVIFVQDTKKNFYKKFMHEPFPVESSLAAQLPNHINAEIVAGTISNKQGVVDYLTWTYYYRRLVMNPSYYGLDDNSHEGINDFLTEMVEKCLSELDRSGCVLIDDETNTLEPTTLGRIASYYYLKHETMREFSTSITEGMSISQVLATLTDAAEFDELPVRHCEDELNAELAKKCPVEQPAHLMDDPHVKAHLLLQAHFSRLKLPISDYVTDTKSVLDQCIRVLQAMVDVAADNGYLDTVLNVMQLTQMVVQARWHHDNSITMLPHVEDEHVQSLSRQQPPLHVLPQVLHLALRNTSAARDALTKLIGLSNSRSAMKALLSLPHLDVTYNLEGGRTPVGNGRFSLKADTEYALKVSIKRMNEQTKKGKAYAPKFPKPIDESWWLVIGDIDNKELLALKRLPTVRSQSKTTLSFITPEEEGEYNLAVFLMSSVYLGLDQQHALNIVCQKTQHKDEK